MIKKLLIIDGNSILNRAFYGVRPLSTKDGIPTNAVFGFINIINRNLELVSPDFCAAAFDLKGPTFRHKMYGDYKAGRKPMPEELAVQFPYAKQALFALGISVVEKEGYEADDILGTYAKNADAETKTFILTGDRDSLQLIDDKTTVILATNTEPITFDRASFTEKYGVGPEQFVDVKSLMGDSSDNIPGVPGIGEKTALKLISQFGSLDGLYGSLPDASLSQKMNDKLLAGKDSAYLSRTLAQICREVPGIPAVYDIEYRGIDGEAAYSLFTKLELSVFIKKFGLSEGSSQYGGHTVKPLPEVNGMPEKFMSDKIALDYADGKFSLCDGNNVFFCKKEDFDTSKLDGIKLIGYDCKEIHKRMAADDLGRLIFECDIMLAEYIIDSGENDYGLTRLVLKYTGESRSEGITSVQYVYTVYPGISEKLVSVKGSELLSDMEMPVAEVLADMELAGFKIDREGIEKYGEKLLETENMLAERIYFAAGGRFNINSPKQLGEVLFDRLGLPSGKKTKTGYSTNAETLEKLRPYSEIIEDILDYRQVAKLRSTYAEGLIKVADADDRVHTNFKQTGTATGRLSSSEPNLQNIPIKTELGREFRRYFVPKNADYLLIDADYSQIELRILAHISGDRNMIEAFRTGADIHTSTAATVFGVAPENVTSEMRKRAKAVNFGILYGMGDFRLSNDLHIPMKQAKEYIENYLASYPDIAAYLERVKAEAREKGYVTTIMGRRRYIPELSGKNKNLQSFGERVAMNSPIQGSAADIIKIAMINVANKLRGLDAHLILQVHDELLIEAHRDCVDEAEAILKYEMENAVKLDVPLNVDIGHGENWYVI